MGSWFNGGAYKTLWGLAEHTFVRVDIGAGEVRGHILFKPNQSAVWTDISLDDPDFIDNKTGTHPSDADVGARFRAAFNWAGAHGYVGAFPNFQASGLNRGHILLTSEVAVWTDISLDDPDFIDNKTGTHPSDDDVGARFRAAFNWAGAHGYVGAFPNFQASGLNRGHILLKSPDAFWRDISLDELFDNKTGKHPSDNDIGARFRAAGNWAGTEGLAAGFPNFQQAYYSDRSVWFDCYGGHEGEDLRYPITHVPGDLEKAIWICCGDPGDTRNTYGRKSGGPYRFGDCSGLVYGLMGVCHQMANRILYASEGHPILDAMGSWLSYVVYGHYGAPLLGGAWPGWPGWQFPQPFLRNMGIPDSTLSAENLDTYTKKVLKLLEEADGEDLPIKEFELMIDERLGKEFDPAKKGQLMQIQKAFLEWKMGEDKKLEDEEISFHDYATQVDSTYEESRKNFAGVLNRQEYIQLFVLSPDESYELIEMDTVANIENPFKTIKRVT